jgi:hypothetical protein
MDLDFHRFQASLYFARMKMSDTKPKNSIEATVFRAFRAAHLLTGSVDQAESAVLRAIRSCDAESDAEEVLFQRAILAAVACPLGVASSPGPLLPTELLPVLDLEHDLRRCFVLRILIGMSRHDCSRLLRFSDRTVNDYTCSALRRLAALDPIHSDASGCGMQVG